MRQAFRLRALRLDESVDESLSERLASINHAFSSSQLVQVRLVQQNRALVIHIIDAELQFARQWGDKASVQR